MRLPILSLGTACRYVINYVIIVAAVRAQSTNVNKIVGERPTKDALFDQSQSIVVQTLTSPSRKAARRPGERGGQRSRAGQGRPAVDSRLDWRPRTLTADDGHPRSRWSYWRIDREILGRSAASRRVVLHTPAGRSDDDQRSWCREKQENGRALWPCLVVLTSSGWIRLLLLLLLEDQYAHPLAYIQKASQSVTDHCEFVLLHQQEIFTVSLLQNRLKHDRNCYKSCWLPLPALVWSDVDYRAYSDSVIY